MLTECAAQWTAEQRHAIADREGELFLDAAAGSGKTSVLVERFVAAVLKDGIDVGRILTITYTEKAAAEMRERIRGRLRELGALEEARATEGAFISTIHGFCARVLRSHALAAGIDPAFAVLDETEAMRLRRGAFDAALEELASSPEGSELIASYGIWELWAATQSLYGQLRSRGELHPRLPDPGPAPDLDAARTRLMSATAAALAELSGLPEPSARVETAIERMQRAADLAGTELPWPGDLEALRIPGGNGAALRTDVCTEFSEALGALRQACADRLAGGIRDRLDRLLGSFGAHYEQRKREVSGLDFADLELLSLALLRTSPELRERYRERFERVMVDELQDTNGVQLELIDAVSRGGLFMVGDAQQSIYAFRHADVELFERRGEELAARGARATLSTNFRTRPQIAEVINRVFAGELGPGFVPLVPGRTGEGGEGPRVELLVVDRGVEEAVGDEPPLAWRIAEARMLAERIDRLIAAGAAAREIVVLTRATTDMRTYEQALEARGIPTYVIGGRGYWSHPQVLDMVAYLRLLANPRDEEALYTVLASPLVGASYDALVLIAAAGRASARTVWSLLRDPDGRLDELEAPERERILGFVGWAAGERALSARAGVQELLERVLERTGYDLAVLALPGGERRLANVRKLMRLGREHRAAHGPALRDFLELVAERSRGLLGRGEEDSEAPVEGEALDAVRLMTIHRAKGLEFEIVCVADLGRWPRWGAEIVRIARDGRLGLRLARPGTGRREPALAYDAIGEEQREAAAREERRLFYVAATRARERLIFSGAANVESVWGGNAGTAPIGWLGPGLVGELPRAQGDEVLEGVAEGVRYAVAAPGREDPDGGADGEPPAMWEAMAAPAPDPPAEPVMLHPASLSYTSLAQFSRCGYRFYAERVLGLPPVEAGTGGAAAADAAASEPGSLDPAERGTIVHALLERVDFRRPAPGAAEVLAAAGRALAPAQAEEIAGLVEAFSASEVWARLGRAAAVRREQAFAFLLAGTLMTGALDVLAEEPGGGALVVDYKTDRLHGALPAHAVAGGYATQQRVYALAALRAGYERVEVVHVFLERPSEPVSAAFGTADAAWLECELEVLVARVERGEYVVSEAPHRALCHGCPAEGGLCSWPLEMTRRESPASLF